MFKAVESCITVARVLSKEQIMEHFFPMVQALGTADWFTSHISAAGLFAVVYSQVPEAKQTEMRKFVENSDKLWNRTNG